MLLPGSTLGMLGGGQLGRMFTIAARTMGYNVIVLEPDPDSPAGQLADKHIVATYDDKAALEKLGKACDVVTTEFENIPAVVLNQLTKYCSVYPSAKSVEKAQDRIAEKAFILSCGLLPVPYGAITTKSEIAEAIKAVEFPAILKTARFGYDGKGQQIIESADDVEAAFQAANQVPCVLEQRIDLECEISVIMGRNENGETQCFPVAENVHKDGILFQTLVPAKIEDDIQQAAQVAAKRMADKLNYVGVLAVEFFVTKKGELLVNEMAPRTHNSGHYTLDACVTSQFEQQVRMVCGLPFGETRLLSPVVMTNLLGDLWGELEGKRGKQSKKQPNWENLLNSHASKLYLYGKKEAREGRKMGHFCTLSEKRDNAQAEASQIFSHLS